MKKLFYMICILSLFVEKSNAQSALETEFIKQLNVYRKQHKLGPVKYDSQVSQVARYHAKYLVQCSNLNHVVHYDKLPHDEQFDIKDHIELTFEQRSQMLPNINIWSEIQIAYYPIKNIATITEIANRMITAFDSSPKHKEIMREDNTYYYSLIQEDIHIYEEMIFEKEFVLNYLTLKFQNLLKDCNICETESY